MKKKYINRVATIDIIQADITKEKVDAIVNAANSQLSNGGGVAQAIRLAAGPDYQAECDRIAAENEVPTGQAVLTNGGDLHADYVINAVGPIYGQENGREDELLASAYRSCINLADKEEFASISFCAISCGIYGYPLEEAATVALQAVKEANEQAPSLQTIRFCLVGDEELRIFQDALQAIEA